MDILSMSQAKAMYRILHKKQMIHQKDLKSASSDAILWREKDQQRGGYNDRIPPRVVCSEAERSNLM
jgi:hypothetical protein